MQATDTRKQPLDAAVTDVRNVPLAQLVDVRGEELRRIVPQGDMPRVPVAAFNASL